MGRRKIDISELRETIQDFVETFLTYEEVIGSGLRCDRTLYEYRPNQLIRRVCLYKDAHRSKEYIITFEMVQVPKSDTEEYKCFMDLMGCLETALPGSFYEDVFSLVDKWVPLTIKPSQKLPSGLVRENTREVLFSQLESEGPKNEVPSLEAGMRNDLLIQPESEGTKKRKPQS